MKEQKGGPIKKLITKMVERESNGWPPNCNGIFY